VQSIQLHHVSKNDTPLACYNFDTRERILISFGRNITDKVSNQKTLYYATSNHLCFCTTRQNGKTLKLHLSLKCQNSTSCCLISSIFLTQDSYSRCCMTPKSCNQCVQLGAVMGHGSEERKPTALQLCCMHNAPVQCILGFLFCKVMLKH